MINLLSVKYYFMIYFYSLPLSFSISWYLLTSFRYGGTITNQIKRLGASCDWSREHFTLDEQL